MNYKKYDNIRREQISGTPQKTVTWSSIEPREDLKRGLLSGKKVNLNQSQSDFYRSSHNPIKIAESSPYTILNKNNRSLHREVAPHYQNPPFSIRNDDHKVISLQRKVEELAKDSENLIITQNRLFEKENELRSLQKTLQSTEALVSELRNELNCRDQKINQLSRQVEEIIRKSTVPIRIDGREGKVLSADEYRLQKDNESLKSELNRLRIESDKLFTENYEFRKLRGERAFLDSEDNDSERAQHTMIELSRDLDRMKRKVNDTESDNQLLRAELNFLRGADCFSEEEIRCILIS